MRGVKSAQARTRALLVMYTTHLILPGRSPPFGKQGAADTQLASFLQIRRRRIGYSIYTTGALWLIVASVILLLADLLHFQ